nr:PAS domain S-box protein [Bacteroidota bacterium]
MSLKKLFLILFGIKFTLIIGLGIMTLQLFLNEEELSKSRDVHFRSWLLADELRQSSDDLTRMARTYVATGNAEYERQYWEVLDILNGKIPRPVNYHHIYWDFVTEPGQKPRESGETISLHDLMKNEGFTSAEFDKLAYAQKNSDELVIVERIAMNAVKGLFEDSAGNFTVKKEPDRELAIRLMNDGAYHKTKSGIMKPIDEFYTMFEKRTANSVVTNERLSKYLLLGIIGLIIVIVGIFIFSFVMILRQIRRAKLTEEVLRQSEGKYRTLVETMTDGVYRSTHEGKFLEVNPAMVKMLGYDSKEELLAIDIKSQLYFTEEDRESTDLEEAHEEMAVFRLRKKDGSEIWVEDHGKYVLDDDGNILYHEGALRDVSERKQAEEALKIRESYLTAIIENQPGLVWLKDLDGRFLAVNSAFAVSCGKKAPQDMLAKTDLDIWPLELAEKYRADDFRVIKQKVQLCVEELIFDQGQKKWFETFKMPIFDEAHQIIGTSGFARDITDRRLAEEALRKSETHLNSLIQTIPDLIWLKDQDGVFLSCNKMFERFFGAPVVDIIGKTDYDFVDKALADFFRKHDRLAITAGKPTINEEWITFADDGHRALLETTKTPMYDSRGMCVGVLGIGHDITRRTKIQDELASKEKHYRTLFNLSPSGIILIDPEGNILDVNESYCKFNGYTPAELRGNNLRVLIPEDKHQEMESHILEILNGKTLRVDTINVSKNGTLRNLELYEQKIILQDGQTGIISIANDITDRKRAEEEIKHKNKELQKLNDEKDKFFSIIAHDLKSPFNSILGFSELLVEQMSQQNIDGITRYAGIIQKSSQRAVDLLMNLMDWSRSQTGRMEFNPEYFEMVSLINEVTSLFTTTAGHKSIIITKGLPSNSPVYADKAMISTVLRNLISNAIKFTMPGGKIIISEEEKQNELTIMIGDTGVGIPKASVDKLFRIDENYSTPGTQNEHGTGLGLILCKEFIGKHDGNIWVKSEEGKGSSFYFSIPCNTGPEEKLIAKNIISANKSENQGNNLKPLGKKK